RPLDGASQCLFSSFYSAELLREGSRARRRLREGMRRRHAPPPRSRCRWKNETREPVERAAGGSADFGDHYRRELREVGAIVSRSSNPHQSMGQRGALGNAAAFVFANDGVSLAGGSHCARNGNGSAGGN